MQFASNTVRISSLVSSSLAIVACVAAPLACGTHAVAAALLKKNPSPQTAVSVPVVSHPVLDEPTTPNIVIGFMGGRVQPDNLIHRDALLIDHLRKEFGSRGTVKAYANRDGKAAHAAILHILDMNRDGTVSPDEARHAHIVIFGHSWGASETVTLARALSLDGIPVMLTVQVDSVRKSGERDDVIPHNVRQAANIFQRAGLVHGRPVIRAENPEVTTILGNFEVSYGTRHISCTQFPWYDRMLMRSHIEIESDPLIWQWIETLISSRMGVTTAVDPAFPLSVGTP
jgi:hypothetical protein